LSSYSNQVFGPTSGEPTALRGWIRRWYAVAQTAAAAWPKVGPAGFSRWSGLRSGVHGERDAATLQGSCISGRRVPGSVALSTFDSSRRFYEILDYHGSRHSVRARQWRVVCAEWRHDEWGFQFDGWVRRLLGAGHAGRRCRHRCMGRPEKAQMIQRSANPIKVLIGDTEPPPCQRRPCGAVRRLRCKGPAVCRRQPHLCAQRRAAKALWQCRLPDHRGQHQGVTGRPRRPRQLVLIDSTQTAGTGFGYDKPGLRHEEVTDERA